MPLTFTVEPWEMYFADCQALWREHYEELATQKTEMRMNPDVPAYEHLQASGQLHILVVRDHGAMVGYFLSVVRKHLHYADVLCGFEDAYFLSATHRKGMAGVRLIREWEACMRRRGVQKIFIMTKPFLDMGPLFKRLGFTPSDFCHAKWIGA